MSPDDFAALAALAFPEGRLAYYTDLGAESELELLARKVEAAELRLGRQEAGRRFARLLGLPLVIAPVAAIMVLSPDRESRGRAAGIVVRALQRAARDAA